MILSLNDEEKNILNRSEQAKRIKMSMKTTEQIADMHRRETILHKLNRWFIDLTDALYGNEKKRKLEEEGDSYAERMEALEKEINKFKGRIFKHYAVNLNVSYDESELSAQFY